MKIGIIGAGRVGTTLGRKWEDKNHEVCLGVRNPDDSKYKRLREEGFQMGSVAEAAAFGEVVVLATPWRATRAAIFAAGDLSGKIVIDCVNPLRLYDCRS